jgi:cytochrome bd ubiquinol oxidase subunit I
VAAWHLLRKNETEFFTRSFKTAAVFGLVSGLLVMGTGDFSGVDVSKHQPAKLAAMESHWETQKAVGMSLWVMPDSANERNSVEAVTIPKLMSLLSYHDPNAEVKGLKDFPKDERPPVAPVFFSFRLMVALGMLMFLLSFVGVVLSYRDKLVETPWYLKIMVPSLVLPYLAGQFGWVVAELGRQPWIVQGMLKTSDGVSKSVSLGQVVVSFIAFVALYGGLGIVDIYLLAKYARKGPEEAALAQSGSRAAGGVA